MATHRSRPTRPSRNAPGYVVLPYAYRPRQYQIPFWRAMDRGCKRALLVWHRRAGKDLTCLHFLISRMPQRRGAYYYYFPTMSQGRKILWEGSDRAGRRFLDAFPPGSIIRRNDTEMFIETIWGSHLRVVGTDRLEVVGPNPVGCVFSEYSLQSPRGWNYVRPILAENDGWAVFNGTPRGRNHMYELHLMAQANPDWFADLLTVDETQAVPVAAIEAERRAGMSEELIQQEFYCSFDSGLSGSYYGRLMSQARREGRIVGPPGLPHDRTRLVHTAWDLGISDSTAIWWFQCVEPWIHLLDYYEASGEGMEHYARLVNERGRERRYEYGRHFAPCDIAKRELGSGVELVETAERLGIAFTALPREKRVVDGIERVRQILPRCRWDAQACSFGIQCLEMYQKTLNEHMSTEYRPVYSETPQHDWTSHGADAFRYLSLALPYTEMEGAYAISPDDGPPIRPMSEMTG